MPSFIRTEEIVGGLLSVTVTEVPSRQELAELAAVEARRDVLRAVVDPKRATPPAEDVLQAQAFLALASLDGIQAALQTADEAVVDVPVDPKGGVRG